MVMHGCQHSAKDAKSRDVKPESQLSSGLGYVGIPSDCFACKYVFETLVRLRIGYARYRTLVFLYTG
jgi:hypothetical protein